MKTCTVLGAMAGESAADNYPVILLCESCFEADAKRGESAEVVSFDDYDSGYGCSCEYCFISVEDEKKQLSN